MATHGLDEGLSIRGIDSEPLRLQGVPGQLQSQLPLAEDDLADATTKQELALLCDDERRRIWQAVDRATRSSCCCLASAALRAEV